MTATLPSLLLTVVVAGLGGGGCALSVEGELPEVELVQRDIKIPGVPGEVRPGEPMITLPVFIKPHERIGLPQESYQSVKVKALTVTLKQGGGGDLSFIRTLHVGLNGLQGHLSGVAPIEVAAYERPASGGAGAVIEAGKPAPVEVASAWKDSATVMSVQVSGDLPVESWTFDVTVKLSAVLAY